MGFSNKSSGGGNGKFARFKEGKIITKIDGEVKTFTTISGNIVDITISTDTYNNKEYDKLTVWLVHEDGCTQLNFPLNSGYGRAFCKILPNVDPAQGVEISGGTTQLDNGNSYGNMFINQGGKGVKWYYTSKNEAGKKVPAVEKVMVGRQEVNDTTKVDAFFQKVIMAWMKKCAKVYPGGAEKYKSATIDNDPLSIIEPIDDMPF